MDSDPPRWPETLTKAAASAIPGFGGPLLVIYEDMGRRRHAAAHGTLATIVDGVGEEKLRVRLEDPYFDAMTASAVESSVRTGIEAKRRLLARAVINAANDEALLDDSFMITQTLQEIDVPHIRALKALADEWRAVLDDPEVFNWGRSEILGTLPAPIVAVLARTGTARPGLQVYAARSGKHRADGITDHGLRIIDELVELGLTLD